MRRMSEVGRPVIDLNPPPGRYALQQFKGNPFKVGHMRRAQARALDANAGWLFGDNPFKMGQDALAGGSFGALRGPNMGAILRLTDDNPEDLPPYNFAMGGGGRAAGSLGSLRGPSTFALGLRTARRRR